MFKNFKEAVAAQFKYMADNSTTLYLTDVPRDGLWDMYLDSFPEGTNNIFRERREYDCNTCKQFIRPFGNVVAIINNEVVSIWDVEVEGYYQVVADALSNYVKSAKIRDIFLAEHQNLGTDHNFEQKEGGSSQRWEHFHYKIARTFVNTTRDSIQAIQGEARSTRDVFVRALNEISDDAVETVLDLISQGSLYRGEEYKHAILAFKKMKAEYSPLDEKSKELYGWLKYKDAAHVARIRSMAIGTLLVDISEGKDLEIAVKAFERIMAPTNYKRPKAIITKKMIDEAQKKIEELGLSESLGRRFAKTEDVTINNVLFANRDAKKAMNVFDELKEDVKVTPKKFDKVEEIHIDDFVKNVLPGAKSIELLLENKHGGNLMSVIAPEDRMSPTMFKWDNNFSWAYNGDITDSMKEAVKSAGGKVDGVLRFSISWNENGDNKDDLDAYCKEPGGMTLYYSNKVNGSTGGNLDVDITRPGSRRAVENITWPNLRRMQEGTYKFWVNNFSARGARSGFTAEIEFNGEIHEFSYDKPLRNKQNIQVAEVTLKDGQFTIKNKLESSTSSRKMWGLDTNKFHKVSLMLNSPNHWDEQGVGNKHTFFILENCQNEETPRGFFNEFLNADLLKQKRVFEVLGSKMRVAEAEEQLSGVGFSSTQRNSVVVKVEGSFSRTLKINF